MKKSNLFFVAALAFFSFSANAQLSTIISLKEFTSIPYSPTYLNITRSSYITPGVVTYFEDFSMNNQNSSFVYNHMDSCYYFDLPDTIRVLDFMQIPNAKQFVFCGKKLKKTYSQEGVDDYQAVIGWFSIYTSNNSVSFFYLTVDSLYAFTELDVTPLGESGANLYFIGEKRTAVAGGFTSDYYIGQTNPYQQSLFGPYPQHCYLMKVDEKEQLYDVVCADDFVAFTGYDNNSKKFLIRKSPHDNFPDMSELEKVYLYNTPGGEPYVTSMATAMHNRWAYGNKNNIVACHKARINDSTYVLRFRMFDLVTMQMFNSQEISIAGKMDPLEMTFLMDNDILAVLVTENYLNISSTTPIIYIQPYVTTNYTADIIDPIIDYYSIDNVRGYSNQLSHFIVGKVTASKVMWFLNDVLNNEPNDCRTNDMIDVVIINNKDYEIVIDPIEGEHSQKLKDKKKYLIPFVITQECISKENKR